MRVKLVCRCLTVMGMLTAGDAAAQTVANTSSSESDRTYCAALVFQYDRYSSYNEGMSADGRVDRTKGEADCRTGNYAEGLRLLKAAIERLGFAPLARGS